MVVMFENADTAVSTKGLEMLQKKFPQYNITSKQWDMNVEKSVKTAFAADEAIDLVMYWPNQMETFVNSEMALDLTPYLDADPDWKTSFADGAIELGTYNGKVFSLPYSTVYPLLEVNTDILEQAGVEVKDQWTWDEFIAACEKIKTNTDAFPIGVNESWACWLVRNGFLQSFDNIDELKKWNAGEISFKDERIVKVFDNVANLYNKEYCYPGAGAITTTLDQVNAAFAQGKIAIKADVNTLSVMSIKESGLKNVKVMSWPTMANSPESDRLLGGSDGYFIPSNTKHPDEAVEMLKYMLGTEVLTEYSNAGIVVPVKNLKSTIENINEFAKDANEVYPKEIMQVSSEMNNYIDKETPDNYIFYGEEVLDELETIRNAAIETK